MYEAKMGPYRRDVLLAGFSAFHGFDCAFSFRCSSEMWSNKRNFAIDAASVQRLLAIFHLL
jgi:hypothetical protein